MPGHGEKLSRKQEQAVAALLAQTSIERAAAQAGVSEKTLRTWIRLPQFAAEYRACRREIVENAVTQVQKLLLSAVTTLAKNLRCGSPATEVAAAKAIYEQAVKGIEWADLEARVTALEQQQKGQST